MALTHNKLAQKRHKAKLKRKNKKYDPSRRYFTVQNKQAVETTVAGTQFVETDYTGDRSAPVEQTITFS